MEIVSYKQQKKKKKKKIETIKTIAEDDRNGNAKKQQLLDDKTVSHVTGRRAPHPNGRPTRASRYSVSWRTCFASTPPSLRESQRGCAPPETGCRTTKAPCFALPRMMASRVVVVRSQPTNQPRVTMPSITRVSSSTEKPHSRDSDGRAKLRISERCAVHGL
ncbi:hypothetical protein BHM03_00048651 [Ensete ventricosum]|nr:hypothetical protein BHM03_00048651 [Ensete ventricosum]